MITFLGAVLILLRAIYIHMPGNPYKKTISFNVKLLLIDLCFNTSQVYLLTSFRLLMKKLILQSMLLVILLIPFIADAQDIYWVIFRDKSGQGFDPCTYFDQNAIDRRVRNGLSLDDPTDWPVNNAYVDLVEQGVDTVLLVSRWFNAMGVKAQPWQIDRIKMLPFVATVETLQTRPLIIASADEYDTVLDYNDADILKRQITSMKGEMFTAAGIDGKGVRIAIFDVGFPGAKENPALKPIFDEGRVIATRDFSKRKEEDVFWGKNHGTHVWSCIAGQIGDKRLGLATAASFLLAKTEVNREPYSEELHWLAAAEWADKYGVDIINSSLGYTQRRYFPWDMDGKTSFISRAANMAARKGILVVNAAGNEGDNEWVTIGTPADADSVLAIGGIDPETGYHTSFSSFGPTADKRLKPNVSAFGHVIVSGEKKLEFATGTSFASPLVAGFAACALQLRKDTPAMDLFHLIEKSGNLYPYFDYAHGYGVPQADYFLGKQDTLPSPTFEIKETADSVVVRILDKFFGSDEQNKEEGSANQNKDHFLYYNIMNSKGTVDEYYVVSVYETDVLTLYRKEYTEGQILNVHFAGFTAGVKL